jgi:serine protease inhibitor
MSQHTRLEDHVKQSGQTYFSSFQSSRSMPTLTKKPSWSWVRWTPLLSVPTFGLIIVSLMLGTTQARSSIEQSFLPLHALNTVSYPSWNQRDIMDDLTYDDVQESMNRFLTNYVEDLGDYEDNVVFSPLSAFSALAMVYEASDTITRQELQNVLNEHDQHLFRQHMEHMFLDTYIQKMQGTQPRVQSRLTNGVFLQEGFPIAQAYLDVLSTHYFAEVFETNFDADAKDAMALWINERTNNFLGLEAEDLSATSDTVMSLLNTLYVRANWLTPFERNEHYETVFQSDLHGALTNVTMMQKTLNQTHLVEEDTYTILTDHAYGDLRVHYVLPSPNETVSSLLNQTTFSSILANLHPTSNARSVQFHVPKFSITSTIDVQMMIEDDVPSLFDVNLADLSNAAPGLYVQAIEQHARFDVFEQGFEAAAVTEADFGVTSTPMIPTQAFVLDRSFLFLMTNSKGLIHFIGIVHQPVFA